MSVMSGLASYEIIKTGVILFILVVCFCIFLYLTIRDLNKNYISTSMCNIKSNTDNTQILTYTVDNQTYTKNIPPSTTTQNNQTTIKPTYPEGSCTLYYASKDPNDYNVNSDPTTVMTIISVVILIIVIIIFIWLLFLRSNREVAGVVGGIDVVSSVFRFARK